MRSVLDEEVIVSYENITDKRVIVLFIFLLLSLIFQYFQKD